MKIRTPRSTVETRTPAKEVLSSQLESVRPFDLDGEFALMRKQVEADLDYARPLPTPTMDYWICLSEFKTFFPGQRDLQPELDFSRVFERFFKESRHINFALLATAHLMQLFPDDRQALLQYTGVTSADIPKKVKSGELILINELLMLAAAHPERLHEYQVVAMQEFSDIQAWITESLTFDGQISVCLEVAANFLLLCPEYKLDMQTFMLPHVPKALKNIKSGNNFGRFHDLCNLEVMYGSDQFLIDERGNLVRQAGKEKLGKSKPLPDRSTT